MNPKATQIGSKLNAANIILTATAALIGWGLCVFPIISDDIASMEPFREFLQGKSGDWLAGVKAWLDYGGGRLTNFISINTSLLPEWVVGVISTFCIFYIFKFGAILGDFRKNLAAVTIFLSLFLLIFPWVDQLYLKAFQINYIWSTALSITIVYRIIRLDNGFSALTFFCCFLLGFWHEAFSCCVLCSLIVVCIIYNQFRLLNNYIYIVGIIPGLLISGMIHVVNGSANYFSSRYNILLLFLVPILIFFFMWIGALITLKFKLIKNSRRRHLLDMHIFSPSMTVFLCSSFICGFMLIYIPTGPRIATFGIYTALIGICDIMTCCVPMMASNKSIASKFIYIPLSAFILIHLLLVDYECYKAKKLNEYVLREYYKDPVSTIYAPMTLSIKASDLCLRKPYYDWFAHLSTTKVFTNWYGIDGISFNVVPLELKDINKEKVMKIENDSTFFIYDDLLIGPSLSKFPQTATLEIHYQERQPSFLDFYIVPLTDKPGLAWYYPNHSYLNQKSIYSDVTSIEVK